MELNGKGRVWMTRKAVDGHYLEYLAKLVLGQLVLRLLGTLWNGKAKIVFG